MSTGIHEGDILDALRDLPTDRWGQVLDYIQALKPVAAESAQPRVMTAADLLASDLVGLWADRDDLGDTRDFARRLRRAAETRDWSE